MQHSGPSAKRPRSPPAAAAAHAALQRLTLGGVPCAGAAESLPQPFATSPAGTSPWLAPSPALQPSGQGVASAGAGWCAADTSSGVGSKRKLEGAVYEDRVAKRAADTSSAAPAPDVFAAPRAQAESRSSSATARHFENSLDLGALRTHCSPSRSPSHSSRGLHTAPMGHSRPECAPAARLGAGAAERGGSPQEGACCIVTGQSSQLTALASNLTFGARDDRRAGFCEDDL